jgi:hypothetical protein
MLGIGAFLWLIAKGKTRPPGSEAGAAMGADLLILHFQATEPPRPEGVSTKANFRRRI